MELIEQIANEKKVIVIGFSLGAQVALQLVSRNPSSIEYAVINSALVRPNKLIQKVIGPSITLMFPLISNRNFSKLQSKILYISENNFERYYKESSEMTSSTLIRILKENMSFTMPTGFNESTAKILVAVGEKEKKIMKMSVKDIVSANSNCTGIIIPNVGHGISLQDASYFNRLIENWLQKSMLPEDVQVLK